MKRYIRSNSSATDFISEINSIAHDYSISRKDRVVEIEAILESAADGSEFYRIVKDSYSGWTSRGGYSDTYYGKRRFVKENGVWENIYNSKRDTHDVALGIVYSSGPIYSPDEIDTALSDAKKQDSISTKEYGLHGKNTVYYPNK